MIDLPDSDDDTFTPKYVKLSDEALETFEEFRQFLHAGKAALDGREREWWSKGGTHVLRLAGTLCFLDWAMKGGSEPAAVTAEFMSSAVRLWREYFWPHSRAALRQVGTTERHANARRALRWMNAKDKDEVSLMDIRREALGHRLDAHETADLMASLEKAGWLKKEIAEKEPGKAGRPKERWRVNPSLKKAMQELQQLQE